MSVWTRKLLNVAALGLLLLAGAPATVIPATSGPECTINGVRCLPQGWNDFQRNWWYTTTQGSRLLPLDWMLALERADGDAGTGERFLSDANMERLGYLSNPRSPSNPHGLPLGFVVDHDENAGADLMCDYFPATCRGGTMRRPWIGMNCATCHTHELTYEDTRFRVEGAATLADFETFEAELLAALKATDADAARFDRFARGVLGGSHDTDDAAALRLQLREQIAWQDTLWKRNLGAVRYGPGRLDAQGHIFNKVSLALRAGEQPEDIRADAPASYPHIWNTAQQDRVQWNGLANNIFTIRLFGLSTDVGALVRNASQAIGVYAHVELDRRQAMIGYASSVRVARLVHFERLLERLQSPRWPEAILPPIDRAMADAGERHFERLGCGDCHRPLAHDDLRSRAGERMVRLDEIGTDIFHACNSFLHRSNAGNLEGQSVFGFSGPVIEAQSASRDLVANAAIGTVVGKLDEVIGSLFTDVFVQGSAFRVTTRSLVDYLPGVSDGAKKAQASTCLTQEDPALAYKARPLNGIWATAPYLHNGSVPTLYDLLLPSRLQIYEGWGPTAVDSVGAHRPESFDVGSRAFDPVKVGLASSPDAQDGGFVFHVRDTATGEPIPGNYNSGHEYGTRQLSHDERMELVEYLKTL